MTYGPKDPWGWLGKKLLSKHCEGKKAIIIAYDHLATIWTCCECGAEYQHEEGISYFRSGIDAKIEPFRVEMER